MAYEDKVYGFVCRDRVGFFANVIDEDEYPSYLLLLKNARIVKVYVGRFDKVVATTEEHVKRLRNGNLRSSQLEIETANSPPVEISFRLV
jgi:hypothetical protein